MSAALKLAQQPGARAYPATVIGETGIGCGADGVELDAAASVGGSDVVALAGLPRHRKSGRSRTVPASADCALAIAVDCGKGGGEIIWWRRSQRAEAAGCGVFVGRRRCWLGPVALPCPAAQSVEAARGQRPAGLRVGNLAACVENGAGAHERVRGGTRRHVGIGENEIFEVDEVTFKGNAGDGILEMAAGDPAGGWGSINALVEAGETVSSVGRRAQQVGPDRRSNDGSGQLVIAVPSPAPVYRWRPLRQRQIFDRLNQCRQIARATDFRLNHSSVIAVLLNMLKLTATCSLLVMYLTLREVSDSTSTLNGAVVSIVNG